MKKYLSRVLIVLMIIVTLFEVVVPPSAYNTITNNVVYAKEEKSLAEKFGDIFLAGINIFISNVPGATAVLNILKEASEGTEAGKILDAMTMIEYEPSRTSWYLPLKTQSGIASAVDTTISTIYNKITDETGLKSNTYIYYLDQDGVKRYPSKRRKLDLTISGILAKNQLYEQVYLVRGTVYKVPRYLILEEVSEGFLEDLEAMISNLIYSLANGVHFLMSTALGKSITIDDLVFNKYSETNISYFESESEVGADMASSLIYGKNGVGGLDSVVNKWYSIFQKIALMGYMAILVYMGIRIILGATAEKKANYKELFMNWVVGIGILLLFPYAMKYIIKINEAIVRTIEVNKGFTSTSFSPVVPDSNMYDKTSIDDVIDWSNGNDYMSQLGFAAYQTEKITLSFAFLIATWQLLVLVFHYFKRLFVIAYLIIIFPLVALSYAVDKIADGKSQALNTWIKEYMINVFVQTFHAIVYVFVCATVYASSGTLNTGNKAISNGSSLDYDFILVIVGITFLFKGEEIIKKIFGQESQAGTMKSLASSAAGTYAKIKMAENAVKAAGKHTFGENAVPRKFARGIKNIAGINKKINNFDNRAGKTEAPDIGARLPNAPTPPANNASKNELEDYRKKMATYNAVATLNNPKTHSLEEQALAAALLKKLAVEDPENEAFKSSNISVDQFQGLAELDLLYNKLVAAGNDPVKIEKEITARMAMIFPSENKKQLEQRANVYFTEKLHGGANNISKLGLENEVQRTIDAINKETRRGRYGVGYKKDEKADRFVEDTTNMYAENDEQKETLNKLARSLYILKQRSSGNYSQKEILDALNEIRNHADDNEVTRQLVDDLYGEELDIDTLAHIISKNVLKAREDENVRMDRFINSLESTYAEEFANLSEEEKESTKDFARNMFIVSHRGVGGYSSEEVLNALEEVNKHADDSEANKEILRVLVDDDSNLQEYTQMVTNEYEDTTITNEEQNSVVELAQSIVNDYEENPREGFYDDELSSHEIIENMDNEDAINQMIEDVFEARKNSVSDANSQVALDILAKRNVDILENHLDTETKTYDGYTKEELIAQKIIAINEMLGSLNPFSDGKSPTLLDHFAIDFLKKTENEKESTYKKVNEKRSFFGTTASEYVENRKKAREKIENDHFMGDVQQEKKK